MRKQYAGSDLACESVAMHKGVSGSTLSERVVGGITVSRLRIETEEASAILEKPCGTYVTFSCGRLEKLSGTDEDLLVHLLAGELCGMTERLCGQKKRTDLGIFAAGLGNAGLTADAIGPRTAAKLTATRHLREHEEAFFRDAACASLSVLTPGVLGQTGIETLELLRGAVRAVKPDAVLVIDALAARDCDRLASTVQLSDVGIVPGSGVGNHRAALNRETLGVPVLALGVPTVVNSATLVYGALQKAGIEDVDGDLDAVLQSGISFFVSPRESDVICERASTLLARSIGLAFCGKLGELET